MLIRARKSDTPPTDAARPYRPQLHPSNVIADCTLYIGIKSAFPCELFLPLYFVLGSRMEQQAVQSIKVRRVIKLELNFAAA